MFAQVIIFSPDPQHEIRLVERLHACTGIMADHTGYQSSFIIQDPSWETLLLLILWESQAACLMAKPAIRAILKHVIASGWSVRDPKMFTLALAEGTDTINPQKSLKTGTMMLCPSQESPRTSQTGV